MSSQHIIVHIINLHPCLLEILCILEVLCLLEILCLLEVLCLLRCFAYLRCFAWPASSDFDKRPISVRRSSKWLRFLYQWRTPWERSVFCLNIHKVQTRNSFASRLNVGQGRLTKKNVKISQNNAEPLAVPLL